MENSYVTLLYYKYVVVKDPQGLRDWHYNTCVELGLKGRIIVGEEGINGTVEGTKENTDEYVKRVKQQEGFEDIWFKYSQSDGNGFPKLSVKARKEIVTTGVEGLDPTKETGKYLSAQELHDWIHSDKEFYIVDMRNDFEFKSGYFKDSILPPLHHFKDLPKVLPILKDLKDKTIVTVCTGGIRCEKASGFLVMNGFSDVYQLHGGIVTYMEMFPNEDFLGKLYVFDGRITMGFNTDSPEHVVVGKCDKCGASSDDYVNCSDLSCHKHFICCKDCQSKGSVLCDLH